MASWGDRDAVGSAEIWTAMTYLVTVDDCDPGDLSAEASVTRAHQGVIDRVIPGQLVRHGGVGVVAHWTIRCYSDGPRNDLGRVYIAMRRGAEDS